jgi:acyl carrier protein
MELDPATREEIIARLLEMSDRKVTRAQMNDSTSLRDDLEIDSLALVTLAADLEDALEIDIDNDQLGSIRTLGDLFQAISATAKKA